ncbi:unnamed protein product [Debaryomyces tyrocola]|nr:unnamed protein product [Debaryomyces tyrocola]
MLSSNATSQTNKNSEREEDLVVYERESNDNITRRVSFAVDQKLIKRFPPAYFGTVMGTGVSNCILYKFHMHHDGSRYVGVLCLELGWHF